MTLGLNRRYGGSDGRRPQGNRRPAHSEGNIVHVNLFELAVSKAQIIFLYTITYIGLVGIDGSTRTLIGNTQRKPPKRLAWQLVKTAIADVIGMPDQSFAYDGANTLLAAGLLNTTLHFNPNALPLETRRHFSSDIVDIFIKLEETQEVDLHALLRDPLEHPHFQQICDIIMTSAAVSSERYIHLDQSKLAMAGEAGIDRQIRGAGAQVIRKGVTKSVTVLPDNQGLPHAYVCIDATKSVMWKHQSLVQTIASILNETPQSIRWNGQTRRRLLTIMKDLKVTDSKGRVCILTGFTEQPLRNIRATWVSGENGQSPMLVDLYQQTNFRWLDWPCFLAGTKTFPIELFEPLDYQTLRQDRTPEFVKRASIEVCSNPPDERWSEIEDYRFDLFESPDVRPILEAFGLRVASTPLADDRHHKLDFPSIRFSERTLHPDPNADWGRHAATLHFFKPATIDLVKILFCCREEIIRPFADKIWLEAEAAGMIIRNIDEPTFCTLDELPAAIKHYTSELDRNENAIIFYVEDNEEGAHEKLKTLQAIYGVQTQHVHAKTAEQADRRNIIRNLLMKVNVKCGGINFAPQSQNSNVQRQLDDALVVGYDVSHSGKHDDAPAVVGFAANIGTSPTVFEDDFHLQPDHKNDEVESFVLRERCEWSLREFYRNRGRCRPSRFIIIRDSVTSGFYERLLSAEERDIERACYDFGWNNPILDFVVSSVGHNLRLFLFDPSTNRRDNVSPGTTMILDGGEQAKFLIQSHKPRRGTAKPTLYTVWRHDETPDFTLSDLRQLLHDLTCDHQPTNSAISMPTPVFKADEASKRGTDIFHHYSQFYPMPWTRNTRGEEVVDLEELSLYLSPYGRELRRLSPAQQ